MVRIPSLTELLASSAPATPTSRRMMAVSTPASLLSPGGQAGPTVHAMSLAGGPVLQPPLPVVTAAPTGAFPVGPQAPQFGGGVPPPNVPGTPQVSVENTYVPDLNAVQQPAVLPRSSTDVNKTPPKVEGSFNLYRAQVKANLHRFNAWGLVDGSAVRPLLAGPAQQQYDQLDFFVKGTLLRGAKVEDAERMCDLPSGREMWEDLEAHHTKREFSNYVWVMKKFFHATYSREQTMDSWLQEIHDTRRAQANLGRVIEDDLTVDVILMGVVHTHRAVVRQFSRIMTPGSRLTLQQVLNTLTSETEMDAIERDEEEDSGKILHVAKKQKTDKNSGQQYGGIKPSAGNGGSNKGGGYKWKKGACHYCGKEGHYQNVCRKWQFDLKHGAAGMAKGAGGKSSGGRGKPGGGGGKKSSPKGDPPQPSPLGMIGRVENMCAVSSTGSTTAVSPNGSDSLEWILDSAAITHTCADRELMLRFPHYVETNTPHESWTGEITREHLVSELEISFVSTEDSHESHGGELRYTLTGVRDVPGCHVNLLSVNALEEEGWRSESRYPENAPPPSASDVERLNSNFVLEK